VWRVAIQEYLTAGIQNIEVSIRSSDGGIAQSAFTLR
jgi:hypothetical protein